MFPAVILSQRNAAKMTNNMPQLQKIQEKMSEARQSGNNFEGRKINCLTFVIELLCFSCSSITGNDDVYEREENEPNYEHVAPFDTSTCFCFHVYGVEKNVQCSCGKSTDGWHFLVHRSDRT